MTLYICQCPHNLPAKVWTAEDEADLRDRLDIDPADDLCEAAAYDMRDAYVTSDPLDLFFWISLADAPIATGARGAYFRNEAVRIDVEAIAQPIEGSGDEERFTALDGRFIWFDGAGEWTLGNRPPVEADDLFHALSEASLIERMRDRLEQSDV